jgi:NAD(P)-dependent dehydrogenase (short-subunit alcohol dehydrogenase family)
VEDMNISTAGEQRVTDLRGQRGVVPGGTPGIALATVKAAARYGAEVIVAPSHFRRASAAR